MYMSPNDNNIVFYDEDLPIAEVAVSYFCRADDPEWRGFVACPGVEQVALADSCYCHSDEVFAPDKYCFEHCLLRKRRMCKKNDKSGCFQCTKFRKE